MIGYPDFSMLHIFLFDSRILIPIFSVQDGSILAWKIDSENNSLELAASLVGHKLSVTSFMVADMLYSASIDHTIKVIIISCIIAKLVAAFVVFHSILVTKMSSLVLVKTNDPCIF